MKMGFGNSPDEVRGARGFTLVELIVTMVLVAVLAAIAAPSFSGMIRHADGRSTARGIANQFRKARDHAMSRGQAVLAKVDLDGGTGSRGVVELHKSDPAASNCVTASTSSTILLPDGCSSPNCEKTHVANFSGDMSMQAATQNDDPQWVCFSPTGEVLQMSGATFSASTDNCGAVWRLYLAESSVSTGTSKTKCNPSSRVDQRNDRYEINMWVVEVPYNGGIQVIQ